MKKSTDVVADLVVQMSKASRRLGRCKRRYKIEYAKRKDALEHSSGVWQEYFMCLDMLNGIRAKIKIVQADATRLQDMQIADTYYLNLRKCEESVNALVAESQRLRKKADQIAPMEDADLFYRISTACYNAERKYEDLCTSYSHAVIGNAISSWHT